jgi:L-lactate dehydrogenase (cytochrome)
MRLSDCNNVLDLRRIAMRKFALAVLYHLDGGADDELSLASNTDAFNDYE